MPPLAPSPTSPLLRGGDLTPRAYHSLHEYINDPKKTAKSYDDMFDGPVYRSAQSAFQRQPHGLHPSGPTLFRRNSSAFDQGLPQNLSVSHWKWLTAAPRPSSAYAGGRLVAQSVARDSAGLGDGGFIRRPFDSGRISSLGPRGDSVADFFHGYHF
jgi:hypothetical protein